MADNRSRIEKLVGMLGSEHDGEVVNAVRMLQRMAAAEKKTMAELLLSGKERIVERVVYRDREPSGFGDKARTQNSESPFSRRNRAHAGRSRHYRDWSEAFDEAERDDADQAERDARAKANGRRKGAKFFRDGEGPILAGLREAYEKGYDVLNAFEIEFAEDVYNRYEDDDELSPAQVEVAERIIRKVARANADSII